MSITIYKDAAANAIFIEDANGVQFLNSLQTTVTNGACNIHDLAKDIDIVSETPYDQFVDQNGNGYGNNSTEVCNALNAIFASSGGTGTEVKGMSLGIGGAARNSSRSVRHNPHDCLFGVSSPSKVRDMITENIQSDTGVEHLKQIKELLGKEESEE